MRRRFTARGGRNLSRETEPRGAAGVRNPYVTRKRWPAPFTLNGGPMLDRWKLGIAILCGAALIVGGLLLVRAATGGAL